jgi:hypothetical protein
MPVVLQVKEGRRKRKSLRSEEGMSLAVYSRREFDCLGFGLCLKAAVTVWPINSAVHNQTRYRQCSYDVTLRRVRAAIVGVKKQ